MSFRPDMNATDTNGTTYQTVVSSPPGGTRRIVRNITIYNEDSGSSDYIFALYDGTTYWIIWKLATVATETTKSLAEEAPGSVFIVKPTWKLMVKLSAVAAADESQITAHWADEIQEKEIVS